MNENRRLLSEDEAAEYAGVSVETIRQYEKFALLSLIEENGKRLFAEEELATVFYSSKPPTKSQQNGSSSSSSSSSELTDNSKPEEAPQAVELSEKTPEEDNTEQPTANREAEQTESFGVEAQVSSPQDESSELTHENRGLREQIEALRSERDWLRERLERLEARSEREQMLLLAESQTVRSLVQHTTEQKRSSWNWKVALPWFGQRDN